MTDPEPPPEPTPPPKPVPPPPPEAPPTKPTAPAPSPTKPMPPPSAPAPPRPGRNPMAVLTAIGFALLFFGLAYLWQEIATMPRADSVDPARLANLESQLRNLQQRLDVVERRPTPAAPFPPPDLRALESRIAVLEQRPATTTPGPAPDLAPIEARIAAAETSARRALALQFAAAALDAGRPLGQIPGAPPALSRFATSAPPTLASLRQDFSAAAATAQAASTPPEPPGVAAQAWQRVAGLVTVRRGAAVLVGSPAAYILGEARLKLDNADIAGTLATLDALDPTAAAAMAPWREKAQSLLDARAALAAG